MNCARIMEIKHDEWQRQLQRVQSISQTNRSMYARIIDIYWKLRIISFGVRKKYSIYNVFKKYNTYCHKPTTLTIQCYVSVIDNQFVSINFSILLTTDNNIFSYLFIFIFRSTEHFILNT